MGTGIQATSHPPSSKDDFSDGDAMRHATCDNPKNQTTPHDYCHTFSCCLGGSRSSNQLPTMRSAWVFALQSPTIFTKYATRQFTTTMSASKNMVVDPFCFRQFSEHEASKSYGGTVFSQAIQEFEDIVNARFQESDLKDGYAPFCKHLFVVNDFTDARVNVLPLTEETIPLVRTSYEARNEKELPVLQRIIPLDLLGGAEKLPVAKHIDLILYSREQIRKEDEGMGKEPGDETAPWGIVSIKAQDVDYELPMNPITVMRNSLGKDQGGSGVPLEREAYMESVNYWKDNVVVS
jgi:hypothetical protein